MSIFDQIKQVVFEYSKKSKGCRPEILMLGEQNLRDFMEESREFVSPSETPSEIYGCEIFIVKNSDEISAHTFAELDYAKKFKFITDSIRFCHRLEFSGNLANSNAPHPLNPLDSLFVVTVSAKAVEAYLSNNTILNHKGVKP